MESPIKTFDLSPEQRQTAKLLGQTVAARYETLCRLSVGAYNLHASKPMAAHALRELESMVRTVLVAPTQAGPLKDPVLKKKLTKARKALRETGLAERMIIEV
jgi:hypothetical protein